MGRATLIRVAVAVLVVLVVLMALGARDGGLEPVDPWLLPPPDGNPRLLPTPDGLEHGLDDPMPGVGRQRRLDWGCSS